MSTVTTWTMDQVRGVSRLGVTMEIDEGALRDTPVGFIRSELAKWIIPEARTFGVEVHPLDVHMRFGPPRKYPFTRPAHAQWSPRTTEIELLGGHLDGEVYQFEGARRSEDFRTTSPVLAPTLMAEAYPMHPTATNNIMRWTRHGWNEEARRWVYAPA